eukprot:m.9662 g.9662  ORF g.9662 m.9662 type:complete len:120 (+) comp7867_c0_seq1:231-590(+)
MTRMRRPVILAVVMHVLVMTPCTSSIQINDQNRNVVNDGVAEFVPLDLDIDPFHKHFNDFDVDNNGMLDAKELHKMYGSWPEVSEAVKHLDENNDHQVSKREFLSQNDAAVAAMRTGDL